MSRDTRGARREMHAALPSPPPARTKGGLRGELLAVVATQELRDAGERALGGRVELGVQARGAQNERAALGEAGGRLGPLGDLVEAPRAMGISASSARRRARGAHGVRARIVEHAVDAVRAAALVVADQSRPHAAVAEQRFGDVARDAAAERLEVDHRARAAASRLAVRRSLRRAIMSRTSALSPVPIPVS